MAQRQADNRRMTAAVSGIVLASLAVLIAIVFVVISVADNSESGDEVEAVGSKTDAQLSPTELTRAPRSNTDQLVVDEPEIIEGNEDRTPNDAVTVDQEDGSSVQDSDTTVANSDESDVITGAIQNESSENPTEDSDNESDDTAPEATTTTATPSTSTPAAAGPVDSQAPTNQSAPGTNKKVLYVDGQNGSDRNPGTKDRPFRRPIEATSIAEPGTTIYLRAGTYDPSTHGTFSMKRSGTPQNWIRIAAHPGERVELVNGGSTGSGFEVLGASYVEVADFTLRGRSDSINGSGVFVKDGAHDVRIVNNNIRGFGGAGISIVKSSNVTIERNEVRDNAHRSRFQGSGISIFEAAGPTGSNGGYSFVIRGNYVVHNYNAVRGTDGRITDGNCIILDRLDPVGFQGKSLIENNVCVENGGRGIHLFRSSNTLIRNNTLVRDVWSPEVESGRGELTAGHGINISFFNNLVFNRSGVASFINTNNQNISFRNNYVLSGPPPGERNQQLSGDWTKFFRSSDQGGPVDQYRPIAGLGLEGTANGSVQSSHDLAGRKRPGTGTVGALEP